MAPLIVLVLTWLALRGLGALGIGWFASWQVDTAYALAAMFLFTASAHFTALRADLVRMVPARLPWPGQIVTITGVLEALGAVGLAIPATRPLAGVCLILLLIAMFPANVAASLRHVPLRGRPPTPLMLRTLLQAVFIGATVFAIL